MVKAPPSKRKIEVGKAPDSPSEEHFKLGMRPLHFPASIYTMDLPSRTGEGHGAPNTLFCFSVHQLLISISAYPQIYSTIYMYIVHFTKIGQMNQIKSKQYTSALEQNVNMSNVNV